MKATRIVTGKQEPNSNVIYAGFPEMFRKNPGIYLSTTSDDGIYNAGLLSEVSAHVELLLRRNGVPMLKSPNPESPPTHRSLNMHVALKNNTYAIYLRYQEDVIQKRLPSVEIKGATLFTRNDLGKYEGPTSLKKALENIVNEFANAYLKANSK
jgi:hypothetical protein